ncbi:MULTISPECIES: hypothetical protein [unclassified Acidovorax]|uniref:hypothetical protein n=1 Tax=unclassified Acidovorax TaxID=2684926 RepID=UPI000B052CA5|nr:MULTISPECIES: hypothetical protein [unclassified Acidovorax]
MYQRDQNKISNFPGATALCAVQSPWFWRADAVYLEVASVASASSLHAIASGLMILVCQAN